MSADPRQQQGERVRGPRPGIHVAEATSSVLHCHGVLALRDRSLSEALLAVLEGVRLVSRQFRKRRLALWAAGRGPDSYFTAMVFWLCETGLQAKLYWQCWKV